ncbi:MAG: cyclase family protein [Candidatus Aminicenantes bacterium]|nr:cyclase family protein [Candidatus Aminicenantes bacterium]
MTIFKKISAKFIFCFFLIVFTGLFVYACRQPEDKTLSPEPKLLDMTYPFNKNSIYWPNAEPFQLKKGDWGIKEAGHCYASNEYSSAEHGRTHADAPIHFTKGGRTIEQIPLE